MLSARYLQVVICLSSWLLVLVTAKTSGGTYDTLVPRDLRPAIPYTKTLTRRDSTVPSRTSKQWSDLQRRQPSPKARPKNLEEFFSSVAHHPGEVHVWKWTSPLGPNMEKLMKKIAGPELQSFHNAVIFTAKFESNIFDAGLFHAGGSSNKLTDLVTGMTTVVSITQPSLDELQKKKEAGYRLQYMGRSTLSGGFDIVMRQMRTKSKAYQKKHKVFKISGPNCRNFVDTMIREAQTTARGPDYNVDAALALKRRRRR